MSDDRKIRLEPPSEHLDYEVGYGKPPVATRFEPGRSGNPGGRPRGARNKLPALKGEQLKTIILEEALALRTIPQLAKAFAYDEMLCASVLINALPLAKEARPASRDPLPRPVIDEDVTQLQEWLQLNGLPKIGRDVVHQAVDLRARETPFHRLREWLDALKWDGTARLDQWLSTYLGAPRSDYHAAIGRMFLIAMAARIFEPGCKADYVLILQGPQGELKSEVCRIVGGEWFSDSLLDIRSKDASQHLRGRWLIELPELSALSRGDIEAWKAFITRTTERYRSPYGRKEATEPRQCVFAGTTNKEEYLRDETGNRRFWPALIGAINLRALKRDRDQLFAEAVDRYRAGEQWWPDKEFERKVIVPEQEARLESDAWEPLIEEHLNGLKHGRNRVRICDVAKYALRFENPSKIGMAEQRRIASVMLALGWRRAPRVGKGRFWEPPDASGW
jgi:predicted P-loop ATPase